MTTYADGNIFMKNHFERKQRLFFQRDCLNPIARKKTVYWRGLIWWIIKINFSVEPWSKLKEFYLISKQIFFFLCEDEKIIKNKEVQREKENDKVILSSLRDLEKKLWQESEKKIVLSKLWWWCFACLN